MQLVFYTCFPLRPEGVAAITALTILFGRDTLDRAVLIIKVGNVYLFAMFTKYLWTKVKQARVREPMLLVFAGTFCS